MFIKPFQNVAVHEDIELVPQPDTYVYKPKRLKWLADLLMKCLRKLDAISGAQDRAVKKFTYKAIHADRVSDLLVEAIPNFERFFHHMDDYIIVMGQRTFDEVVMGFETSQAFIMSRHIRGVRSGPIGYQQMTWRGFDVLLAPMAEGCALIPRVYVETKKVA